MILTRDKLCDFKDLPEPESPAMPPTDVFTSYRWQEWRAINWAQQLIHLPKSDHSPRPNPILFVPPRSPNFCPVHRSLLVTVLPSVFILGGLAAPPLSLQTLAWRKVHEDSKTLAAANPTLLANAGRVAIEELNITDPLMITTSIRAGLFSTGLIQKYEKAYGPKGWTSRHDQLPPQEASSVMVNEIEKWLNGELSPPAIWLIQVYGYLIGERFIPITGGMGRFPGLYTLQQFWFRAVEPFNEAAKEAIVIQILGMGLNGNQLSQAFSLGARKNAIISTWYGSGTEGPVDPEQRVTTFREGGPNLKQVVTDCFIEKDGLKWMAFTLDQATDIMNVIVVHSDPKKPLKLENWGPSPQISGYPKHIIDIKGRFRSLPWGLKVTLREIVLHMNTKQNWEASNEAQLQLGSLAADM
ncbi:hypothetical protein FRB93_002287 [Tulasnella sp. JGI-2019a]|nr:hypothetical protein FRB93_002287 [Tulasnella sp. JGI-2019a]